MRVYKIIERHLMPVKNHKQETKEVELWLIGKNIQDVHDQINPTETKEIKAIIEAGHIARLPEYLINQKED